MSTALPTIPDVWLETHKLRQQLYKSEREHRKTLEVVQELYWLCQGAGVKLGPRMLSRVDAVVKGQSEESQVSQPTHVK